MHYEREQAGTVAIRKLFSALPPAPIRTASCAAEPELPIPLPATYKRIQDRLSPVLNGVR